MEGTKTSLNDVRSRGRRKGKEKRRRKEIKRRRELRWVDREVDRLK